MRRPCHSRKQPGQQAKEEVSSLQKILSNSAVILTVITAVLYFHGRSLYGGYLSYWGLGSDLFHISTKDALMNGVNVYVRFGFEKWLYFAGIVLYIVAIYAVVFFLCYKRPMELVRKALQSKVINDKQKLIVGELATFVQRLCAALLVVLSFILLTAFAQEKGHQLADDQHKKMISGQPLSQNRFEKVSLVYQSETGQNKNISGYRLATSSTLCALCTEEGVQVLPLAKIVSMRITERVEMRAEGKSDPE